MVNVIKNRHTSHFVLFPCLENLRENLAVAQRLRDAPRRLKIAGAPGVCAHVQCAPELDTTCAVLDQCARSRRLSSVLLPSSTRRRSSVLLPSSTRPAGVVPVVLVRSQGGSCAKMGVCGGVRRPCFACSFSPQCTPQCHHL